MTSDQATQINSALQTTGQTILGDFITVLPAIGTIIGIAFVIFIVSYWLKKLRRAK